MGSSCSNRRTPESLRQEIPCRIDAKIKRRTGHPKWWCETHGQPAWGPDGDPVDRCVGSSEAPISEDEVLEVDLDEVTALGVWGALSPAFSAGHVEVDPGAVHVHVRADPLGPKLVDRSFQQVRLRRGVELVTIDGEDARAWSLSAVAGVAVTDVSCRHCRRSHTDRDEFAVRPHVKHQCLRCSRDFWAKEHSVGNPLASMHERLSGTARMVPKRSSKSIDLDTRQLSGVAIWASNPAIVWIGDRAETSGLHVHAWDRNRQFIVDETFGDVQIDGVAVEQTELRHLQVARGLPGLAGRVDAIACGECGSTAVSETRLWTPATSHKCARCPGSTHTRLRLVSNSLVEMERGVRMTLS